MVKGLFEKLLTFFGILSMAYLIVPKKANAQFTDFAGMVRGAYAQNAKVHLINPFNDTLTATASWYVPKLDAYYWSETANPGWINNGDTCDIYIHDAANSGKRQDLWVIVGGSTNSVITAFLDKNLWNYSVDVINVTNGTGDTLIDAFVRIKHQGRWSDAVRDTFNTTTGYDDISLNAAKSESVQVWTNNGNNPNAILGDSVLVEARSINNPNKVGFSRGTVRRFWYNVPYSTGGGWGDHLPDIVLQVGVPEDKSLESKLGKYELQVLENPSKKPLLFAPGYEGKKTGLRVYGVLGDFIKEYVSENGRWQLCDLKSGVYFAVVGNSRKKIVVVE